MEYFFLYKQDGSIAETHLSTTESWTNIPTNCVGVLGGIVDTDATAQDAHTHPERYIVQNDKLVLQPYLTLVSVKSTTQSGQYTVTATLNNPPTILPTSVTFTILGQTYTSTLNSTNLQASLTIQVHPSVESQVISVQASVSGCVSGLVNVGGIENDISLQCYMGGTTATPTMPTIAPTGTGSKSFLLGYYALNITDVQTFLADISTAIDILYHFSFEKVPASFRLVNKFITWAQNATYTPMTLTTQDQSDVNALTFTTDEQNALTDVQNNLLPNLNTTLANAFPNGGTKQYEYSRFVSHNTATHQSFTNYVNDLNTIPNLA